MNNRITKTFPIMKRIIGMFVDFPFLTDLYTVTLFAIFFNVLGLRNLVDCL